MVEVGLRTWGVERTTRSHLPVDQNLTGLSVAWFLSDNVSLGIESATFSTSLFRDSVVLDAKARLYWTPLSRWSPWTSLGIGGAFGMPEGNAIRVAGSVGVRWIPPILSDRMALDLQLAGVERWRQDWAVEYVEEDQPSGRIEWSMVHSPWTSARRGVVGRHSPLGWPVLGISCLF